MSNYQTKNLTWLTDSLILAVAIAIFYSLFLGTRALAIPDEQRYAEIGREMLVSGHYLIPHIDFIKYFEKPDLFYWLQALSIKLFGVNEWAARFWVAIFGVGGTIVTYLASRKLFDRTTGWLAAFILATSLLYYCMAHIVTLDIPVSFFLTASLLSFIVATTMPMGKKRRSLIYLAAITSALAVLTKGLIGIVFPLMIIGVWILLGNDWRLLGKIYLPSGLLVFFIVAAPWHIWMAVNNPHWAYFYIIQQQFLRYSTDYAQRYQPVWFFLMVLIVGLFPWICFLPQTLLTLWRDRVSSERRPIYFFLLLWSILIIAFFSFSKSKLIGYIIPAFPPLAIIIAYYLRQAIANSDGSRGIRYGWLVLTLLNITLAGGLPLAVYYAPMAGKSAIWPVVGLVSLLLLVTAIGSLVLLYLKTLRQAVITLLIGMVLILPCLNVVSGYFDDRSIKPMAITIQPLLTKQTEVICYRHYYQDLPFYLQRRVIIADWEGELAFGIHHQHNIGRWIWSYQQFIQRWNQGSTLRFAMMRRDEYQKLKQQQPQLKLYPIQHNRRDILVSNRRIQP